MPELPEVETIKRGLQKVIVGRKIVKFESRDSKVVQFAEKEVEGLFITNIQRRAKILVFYLSKDNRSFANSMPTGRQAQDDSTLSSRPEALNNKYFSSEAEPNREAEQSSRLRSNNKILLCHLKMTGQLIWEENPGESEFCLRKKKGPSTELRATTQRVVGGHPSPDWVNKLPNKYTRAIITFDDNSVLFFNDLRRFGYMKLYDIDSSRIAGAHSNNKYSSSEVEKLCIPELSKLGPEPFSPDFNIEYLMGRASKIPNRKIKQFITDQEIISGVGNIYVDEALFYAGVLPTRPVKDILKTEWQKIIQSITKALELGLKYGGSSEDTYVDAFGSQGTMNSHTKVYRHTGELCQLCGTRIERMVVGGRGTHFCPVCQK